MKHLLGAALWILSVAAWAQSEDPQDPKVQEKIRNLRIAYITDKLGLTPEQAERFWPVYREFSEKRRSLHSELQEARKRMEVTQPDPEKQKELIELGLQVKQRELDLEREYSGRILAVISAQQLINLRKAETDFNQMILNQIQQRRLQQQRQETFQQRQQLRQERKN